MKIIILLLLTFNAFGQERPESLSDFPVKFSDWKIFLKEGPSFKLNDDVHIYNLRTPLFTDYSLKLRTITLPKGQKATWFGDSLEFPVGTILTKTFYYDPKDIGKAEVLSGPWGEDQYLVETRLLYKSEKGWFASTYAWRGEEAHLVIESQTLNMKYKGEEFEFLIPSQRDCLQCHKAGAIGPVRADNLNLVELIEKGLVEERNIAIKPLPVWNDPHTGSVKERAHAYFEVNCAHCHNPKGKASYTYIDYRMESSPSSKGHCKITYSSDVNEYVIYPGKPHESEILVRLKSRDVFSKMPEIGRDLVHKEGVSLINQYIQSFKGECE